MADFISDVKKNLPKAFESEDYATRREATVRSIDEEKAKLFAQIRRAPRSRASSSR